MRARAAMLVLPALAIGLTVSTLVADRTEADRLYEKVELAAAAKAYSELVELAPDDAGLRIRLADCLTRTSRFSEAIEHAEKAVALTDRSARALAALGLALHRKGDFDAAEARLREATESDPECARCWWGLGRVVALRGDYEAAAEHFQSAAALDPDNPIFLRQLASYVVDRDKRKEIYRRYLELPRKDELAVWENARTWLALLEHAGDRRLNQIEIPQTGTQIKITEHRGMSYISVDIGSRKNRRYLFDTGASGFTISNATMKRLKLEPIDVYTITGIGGKGVAEAKMVLVDEVRVGEAIVRNVPAVVRDTAPLVDGLMGPSFFGGRTVMLDHENHLVRVGQPLEAEPKESDQESEKKKKKKKRRRVRETVEIPFLSINATPFISIQVDGVTMNAMVDTGASQASLSEYSASQVPGLELMAPGLAPPAYREIFGSTGSQSVRVVRRAELVFAGRTLKMVAHLPDPERVLVRQDLEALSHGFGTEVWAILGNPQLDDFNMTIDWGRQVLRMTRFR